MPDYEQWKDVKSKKTDPIGILTPKISPTIKMKKENLHKQTSIDIIGQNKPADIRRAFKWPVALVP